MELIIVSLIGFVQVLTLEFVRRNKKDVKAVKDQIVNHHPKSPNFRDENDKRHSETRSWFTLLLRKTSSIEKRLDSQDETLDELLTGFLENRERIEDIESTQQSKGKK